MAVFIRVFRSSMSLVAPSGSHTVYFGDEQYSPFVGGGPGNVLLNELINYRHDTVSNSSDQQTYTFRSSELSS